MRKTATLAIVVVFVLALGTICLAQTGQQQTGQMGNMMSGQGMMGQGATGQGMMGQGMMGQGMMGQGMMMGGMMGKSLVSTEDGGVVVMIGNKLYKYDKNLELKKEVEIEIDYQGMQNMMRKVQNMATQTGQEAQQ